MNSQNLIKNPWKTLKSKTFYRDATIRFMIDEVVKPNGKKGVYSFIEKTDGVAIVAKDKDDKIYLIGEWKYPVKDYVWLIPAGGVENGEKPLTAAKHELQEEVGIKAKNWHYLGYFYCSAGTITERAYMFLAEDLARVEKHPEPTEKIEIKKVSLGKAFDMVVKNQIKDSYAVVPILICHSFLKNKT